jgi:hypothetical protein
MREAATSDRVVSLGQGLASIPERLLLAHARGSVLFVAGAGASQPATLPNFRELVLQVYEALDRAVYAVISKLPTDACNRWNAIQGDLTDRQMAEVRRFIAADYDVVLGMLERRIDGQGNAASRVRQIISKALHQVSKPAEIHRSLMRLADRGDAVTIVTTNFEHLLQKAAKPSSAVQTHSLGAIPRPSRGKDFAGVLHVHGALNRDKTKTSDFIVSDQDFGEFYLRRRVVPDFIYDAARLFHLVLVGYSANDPPMRYLLNAVAADGTRFEDVKERFAFVGMKTIDPVLLEDWKGRGITPIYYDSSDGHTALGRTLRRWADLSAINGQKRVVDSEIRRIVRTPRSSALDSDRDLFDHLIRRSDSNEVVRLSALASESRADLGWLSAITDIASEPGREMP